MQVWRRAVHGAVTLAVHRSRLLLPPDAAHKQIAVRILGGLMRAGGVGVRLGDQAWVLVLVLVLGSGSGFALVSYPRSALEPP